MSKEKEKREVTVPRHSKGKLIFGALIFYIMLVIGFGLLFSPLLETTLVNATVRQNVSFNFTGEQLAANLERQGDINVAEDIAIPELPEVIANIPYVDFHDIIGTISIESVDVYLPIFYGASHINLLSGAGTMLPYQAMGVGNYPLVGHHMRDPSLLFGPIMNVQIGHWIQLNNGVNIYTYRVVRTDLIHQSQVEILDDTRVPTVTLITCDTPTIATDFRFIVQGELIDESSLAEVIMTPEGLLATVETNPYLETYYRVRERNIRGTLPGVRDWAIRVLGVSFVVLVLGVILFTGIERKYREMKRKNEDKLSKLQKFQ